MKAAIAQVDPERWRHTKGVTSLRQPKQLAIARSLWQTRDKLAKQHDVFQGKILSDTALVEAARDLADLKPNQISAALAKQPGFTGPLAKRKHETWVSTVQLALEDDPSQMLQQRSTSAIPPPRLWQHINELAAKRWERARQTVVAVAEANCLPTENLMTVAILAQIIWPDDLDISETGLRDAMTAADVRPWQQDLLATELTKALR